MAFQSFLVSLDIRAKTFNFCQIFPKLTTIKTDHVKLERFLLITFLINICVNTTEFLLAELGKLTPRYSQLRFILNQTK